MLPDKLRRAIRAPRTEFKEPSSIFCYDSRRPFDDAQREFMSDRHLSGVRIKGDLADGFGVPKHLISCINLAFSNRLLW